MTSSFTFDLAKFPIESLGLGALLGALIAEHSGDQRDLRGASSGWCGETLGVSAPFLDAPVAFGWRRASAREDAPFLNAHRVAHCVHPSGGELGYVN